MLYQSTLHPGLWVDHSVHHFDQDWNILTIQWIATKFGSDVYGLQRLNTLVIILIFHLAPPAGQSFFRWNISISTGWVYTKFGTDLHSSQTIYLNHFGSDTQIFPLQPTWDWNFWFLVKCPNNYYMDYHQFCTDNHISLRMNSNNFGDPLTFSLKSSVLQKIPAKLKTFPLDSDVAMLTC